MIFGIALAYAMRMVTEGSNEYLMDDAQESMKHGFAITAATELTEYLQKDPNNPDAHANLARAFAMENKVDLAAKHYISGIELLLRQNKVEEATVLYQELMHHSQGQRPGLMSELRIARHMADTGDFKEAVPVLETIALDHPGTPETEVALMKLGELCMGPYGDPAKAARCYELFLKDYPFSSYRPVVEKSLAEAKNRIQAT
jgi:predicted Zn-dependent protease